MTRTRPPTGELIAAGSGLLLMIALFLPWYSRDTAIAGAVISQTWTAWQALLVIASLLFLIGIVAIAVPFAPKGFRSDRALLILGVLALILVLFRTIDLPLPDVDLVKGDSADSGRGAGLFLALLAAAGVAFGGLLSRPR
jgi:hypothetical protein